MSTGTKIFLAIGLAAAAILTTLGAIGASNTQPPIGLVAFLQIFGGGVVLGVTALAALRAAGSSKPTPPPPPPSTLSPKSGA